MKKRILGRTGLAVGELSLGGLFVSSHGAAFAQSKQAVLRALELGVNYIDTAPTYFDSEEVLGKALEGVKTPLYLSTKIGGRLTPFLPQDPTCLRRSVEESLARLKRDRVDILMVHEPDRPRNVRLVGRRGIQRPSIRRSRRTQAGRSRRLHRPRIDHGLPHRTYYPHGPLRHPAHRAQLQLTLARGRALRLASGARTQHGHRHRLATANGRALPGPRGKNTARECCGWVSRVSSSFALSTTLSAKSASPYPS